MILIYVLAGAACRAEPRAVLIGTVMRVVDGDTVDVKLSSGLIRVRLYGIDAPERAQPGGKEATVALEQLVKGKSVEIEPERQDRYDRVVAVVHRGKLNVNEEMLRQGAGWGLSRVRSQIRCPLLQLGACRSREPPWIVATGREAAGRALGVAKAPKAKALHQLFRGNSSEVRSCPG